MFGMSNRVIANVPADFVGDGADLWLGADKYWVNELFFHRLATSLHRDFITWIDDCCSDWILMFDASEKEFVIGVASANRAECGRFALLYSRRMDDDMTVAQYMIMLIDDRSKKFDRFGCSFFDNGEAYRIRLCVGVAVGAFE